VVLEKDVDDAADIVSDWLRDAVLGVARIDAVDGRADAGEDQVENLAEDGPLVVEVQVEGAPRDPGRRDDVVDLRGVVAAAGKDIPA